MGNVIELSRALERGGSAPHLGDLCWPELRIGDELVERETLREALVAEGLPEAWAPPDPSGQRALGSALARCAHAEAAPRITIERESLRSRIALVRASDGAGLTKSTRTLARVSVDDLDDLLVEWATGSDIDSERANAEVAVDMLRAQYSRQLDYVSTPELGSMVVETIQAKDRINGLRVRADGGVYYVPADATDMLHRFAKVIATIGGSRLVCLPIHDSPAARADLGKSVAATLSAEVHDVLAGLRKLGSGERGPRESSIAARLGMLDALTARAESARIVLDSLSEDIETEIKTARLEVVRALAALDEDEAPIE